MASNEGREVVVMGEHTITRDAPTADITPPGAPLARVWDGEMRYLGTYEEVFGG